MSVYNATILGTSGLVSYWELAETHGTTAADANGANTGTYNGSITLAQAPPYLTLSGASSFPGATSAYVLCKSGAILAGLTNFTIEAWVKLTTNGSYTIYCERAASGNDIVKLETASGVLQFTYRDDANTLTQFQAGANLNTSLWNYVVLTKSGTTIILYIWQQSTNPALPMPPLNAFSSTLSGTNTMTNAGIQSRIADDLAGGNPFNGNISSVAIYNVALSSATIASHLTAALGPLNFSRAQFNSLGTVSDNAVSGMQDVPNLRLTQAATRTFVFPTDANLRLTQEAVRTFVFPTDANLRLTQMALRIFRQNTGLVQNPLVLGDGAQCGGLLSSGI